MFFAECGIEECFEGCKRGTACDCNPKDSDVCKYAQNFARKIKKYSQLVATYISFYTDRFTLIIIQVLQDFYLSITRYFLIKELNL